MQLPEPPPPPLAPLWDRVLRARALPPDLDVQLLYTAIRDRLLHSEWEVRLHALRVLADLLPLSGNALDFPFDQVVDNLGHNSPNVRKAALDALKVFCNHCEEPECAARAILDKCSYNNIRPHSADMDAKVNVVTGLILSIPAVLGILKRRYPLLDTFPIFNTLGDKLFDPMHSDVALRSLLKLRRVFGAKDYMRSFSQLDPQIQDKFTILCETYDADSLDVHYGTRRNMYHNNNKKDQNNSHLLRISHAYNSVASTPARLSTDSSSEDSYFNKRDDVSKYNGGYAKVIIETEIKFDADTAITMRVLEENETETESEKNLGSEEDCDSSDRNMLKYSDGDSEDTDVVVSQKRVRFGGESFKIRTPDSDNITSDNINSEDDNKSNEDTTKVISKINESPRSNGPIISNRIEEIKNPNIENYGISENKLSKRSGIPLPVIQTKVRIDQGNVTDFVKTKKNFKLKSRSLSELYDYFRTKNGMQMGKKENSGFALTLTEVRSPEKVPSPVESHREVEVLHNLQRSPSLSPRRRKSRHLQLEQDGFVLSVIATTPNEERDLLSPRAVSPLRHHYAWERLGVMPQHVIDQLHNTENWISAVKAADQLHGALLESSNVEKVEPAAMSLVQHMWALSDTVSASRAPAEGAVCAVFRSSNSDCARELLPALIPRLTHDPPPAALPHALLQRIALHHLVDLIFDPKMLGISSDSEGVQSAQLRATLCIARCAGPAAVLAAVRRRLAGTARADTFCQKLRDRLSRPIENARPHHIARSSQLPLPVRRRARSTPPPAAPLPPRRLRPLPDSAPLPGVSTITKDLFVKRLSPIPLSDKDSSAVTAEDDAGQVQIEKQFEDEKKSIEIVEEVNNDIQDDVETTESPLPPRSPSIRVEDYSERTHTPSKSLETASLHRSEPSPASDSIFGSQKSLHSIDSPVARRPSSKSTPSPKPIRGLSPSPAKSGYSTPDRSDTSEVRAAVCERDVRMALAECIAPPRHEDWEVTVSGLLEAERLATDEGARAPATSWRAVSRSAAGHVRSLRSRVARTACNTLGTLFECRGRLLESEMEEAAGALLERCADVNRFLRGDAAAALVRVTCAGRGGRAVAALVRRGTAHRAAPVRAAAANALAQLVLRRGASRALDLPAEPRMLLLRTAAELLGDASAETRAHARRLCLALAEDVRFRPMLKESMPPARYRSVEKNVDKLRCR